MSAPFNVDMDAVTRLTKAGRLLEATALLQRGLSETAGQESPSAFDNSAGHADGDGPMIDMAPPSAPDGAWTSTPATAPGHVRGKQARVALATPAMTHSFLDRTNTWQMPAGLPDGAGMQDPLPAGACFDMHAVRNAAGTMGYKLYIPSGYAGKPLPLVVMLHGCTQTPDDFAVGTRMNEVAEELPCLVAYPEQTNTANASKCWNWFRPGDQQRDRGEPSLIADITRQVMRDFAVDPASVFVAGLSAGGAAAAIMGQRYPDLYKGVCVHSGLACGSAKDVPSAFAAMRTGGEKKASKRPSSKSTIPTIVFHGSADNTVSPVNADQVVHQCISGAATSAVNSHGRSTGGMDFTRTVQTNKAGTVVLEKWILKGAGHAWSGGSNKGSYTEPSGPDASREMMRFFAEVARAQASV